MAPMDATNALITVYPRKIIVWQNGKLEMGLAAASHKTLKTANVAKLHYKYAYSFFLHNASEKRWALASYQRRQVTPQKR